MAKKARAQRNPIAKALKTQKPKVVESAKAYKRKAGQAKTDLKKARERDE